MSKIELYHGDCLEILQNIPDKSVDLVLTDPPYGTTACKWDNIIPFDEMWFNIKRIRKEKSAACLFGSEPFSSKLRISNLSEFKYDWIWEKDQGANFMLCKYQPYKVHEIISVFFSHKYFAQMEFGKKYISGSGFAGEHTSIKVKTITKNDGTRYPRSVKKFSTDKYNSHHPTQKPTDLLEYLIKTYTKEGQTVLDFTMGSGSTGVAAKQLNRNFIGIEKDDKYFEIAKTRIDNASMGYQLDFLG